MYTGTLSHVPAKNYKIVFVIPCVYKVTCVPENIQNTLHTKVVIEY